MGNPFRYRPRDVLSGLRRGQHLFRFASHDDTSFYPEARLFRSVQHERLIKVIHAFGPVRKKPVLLRSGLGEIVRRRITACGPKHRSRRRTAGSCLTLDCRVGTNKK